MLVELGLVEQRLRAVLERLVGQVERVHRYGRRARGEPREVIGLSGASTEYPGPGWSARIDVVAGELGLSLGGHAEISVLPRTSRGLSADRPNVALWITAHLSLLLSVTFTLGVRQLLLCRRLR